VDILKTSPFSFTDIRRYSTIGDRRVLRTGSVFLDPTPCGFFLLLPFAVAVEARLRRRTRGATLFAVLIAAGLVLTQTRAARIGPVAFVFLAARPAAGRVTARRLQFACISAAALVLTLPALATIGLTERVTTTASAQDSSSTDHVRSFWDGIDAIVDRPLGH